MGGDIYEMKPLSLATFGELEAAGIPLTSLSSRKNAGQNWARLFAHLADRHESDASDRLLADLLKDPIALKRFQQTILDSLQSQKEAADNKTEKRRRTVKNPLEEKPSGDDMREEETESNESLDMTYLFMLSRLSGISLSDLSRMTFKGIHQLQEWLKEHPPEPPMQSLLGNMG